MRLTPTSKSVAAALVGCAAVLLIPGWGAKADTASPGVSFEGWFALNRPQNPVVPVPCTPGPTPCGPVNPAPVPAPQSPGTGAYVVSSAGGDSGRSTSSGDTGWTAFQWDLLSYTDATVNQFTVTLSHAPDNRGDFGTPVFQACNIVAPWASEPGPNPWPDRPVPDCSEAIVPELKDGKYVFDLAKFAQTWVEGKGYGAVIVPGTPTQTTGLAPFQFTFAGYYSTVANAPDVTPKVAFDYTPALDESGGFGSGAGSIFDDPGFSGTTFGPTPGIDIIPDDVGSRPVDTTQPGKAEVAGPPLRRTAAKTGFPLSALLLMPLAALAFWGVGTALGPAGDPVTTRKGGVSRMLERRRSENTPPDQRSSPR